MEDQKSQSPVHVEDYQSTNPVEHHLELLKQSFDDMGKGVKNEQMQLFQAQH